MKAKRVGVLTGGEDRAGLVATIRAACRTAFAAGYDAIGIEDGFEGPKRHDEGRPARRGRRPVRAGNGDRIRVMRRFAAVAGAGLVAWSCHQAAPPREPSYPEPSPRRPPPVKAPAPTPTTLPTPPSEPAPPPPSAEPRPIGGPIVSAWSEPHTLPAGGGSAQILVRVRKKNGAPYAGVQVRLEASEGRLFSAGRLLTTDGRGMVRDRLTTHRTSTVTVNAGGSVSKLWVAVGDFSR